LHSGEVGDVGEPGTGVAPVGENLRGGLQDRLAGPCGLGLLTCPTGLRVLDRRPGGAVSRHVADPIQWQRTPLRVPFRRMAATPWQQYAIAAGHAAILVRIKRLERGQMVASVDERRAALARRFPTWTPMALHQRLERCAEEFADRPLVITDERTVTYAETA